MFIINYYDIIIIDIIFFSISMILNNVKNTFVIITFIFLKLLSIFI